LPLLLICALLIQEAPDSSWQWPVDTRHGASSSFGEYRGERFHLGLDFSTGGVEGMEVRPARAGEVFRVRAERDGYGLAVYMRHDGYITVYAHLAAFGPKLAAAIKAAGADPTSEFGELRLRLALEAGDLLAHTGESGAGMPHFHFETRDANNRPLDPMTLDFPPLPQNRGEAVLTALRLIPLNRKSLVNGGFLPFVTDQNQIRIQARGAIGLQALAHIDGPRDNRLGCREARVFFNGELIAEWRPRRIDFAAYRTAAGIYDQVVSGFGPTQFAYAFDNRAATLPPTPGLRWAGPIEVAEAGELAIELMNLAGERSRYAWTLAPDAPPRSESPQPWQTMPTQATTLTIAAAGPRVFITAGMRGSLQTPDSLTGLTTRQTQELALSPDNPAAELIWRTEAGSLKRTVALLPEKAAFQRSLGAWSIEGGNDAAEPMAAVLEPADPKIMSRSLAFLGPVLWFGRHGLPADIRVGYDLGSVEDARHAGLFYWSFNKQKWRFLEAVGEDGALAAQLDHFAPLAAARDISAPRILQPFVHEYFTGPRVVIPVTDEGSGVDPEAVAVSRNDTALDVYFDTSRRWIVLPAGALRGPWDVSAKDRSGRAARVRSLNL